MPSSLFLLYVYIGDISGSNPDINEITDKTLINCNRSFTKEGVLFVWGDFVFNGQDAKDPTELERDATELEVFTAFYFKAVASFLFQTVESVITAVTK